MEEPSIRMYVDENGHQTLKGDLTNNNNRFLCLTGVIMPISEHSNLTYAMDGLKQNIFGTKDIILHRRELISAASPFEKLKNPDVRQSFNAEFLSIVKGTKYRVISVVIDKMKLVSRYGTIRAHDPYALALEYLMQRYQYWMQEYTRQYGQCSGDILAESRGGREDLITKSTYNLIYNGRGYNPLHDASKYYSSGEIKLKKKNANIAGLQFVDLISHPARRYILSENDLAPTIDKSSFEQAIVEILVRSKFRRRNGIIEGHGAILYPN